MALQERFHDLLVRAAAELYQDHRDRMQWPDLIPTPTTPPHAIDDADLGLLFEGLDRGLIRLERGGKFNTLDQAALHRAARRHRQHQRVWLRCADLRHRPVAAAQLEVIIANAVLHHLHDLDADLEGFARCLSPVATSSFRTAPASAPTTPPDEPGLAATGHLSSRTQALTRQAASLVLQP